jgi:outer membrane protein OmpA-like peptidoglycan-associated protein
VFDKNLETPEKRGQNLSFFYALKAHFTRLINMRTGPLLLLFLIGIHPLQGQNLVINPSFEEKEFCPSDFTMQVMTSLKYWKQVGDGTPDYFHSCSKRVGVPNNIFGVQTARTGEAYVGMGTFLNNNGRYREYLFSKLTRPLKAGEMVCISLFYSAAENCQFVHDGFGVALSKFILSQPGTKPIKVKEQAMSNPKLNMLDETNGWSELSMNYIAEGGEQFITIGNFNEDNELKLIRRTQDPKVPAYKEYSYIFIDDVSVVSIQDKKECSCINEELAKIAVDPPLELQEFDEIRLDAVHFQFDEFTLTDSAVHQLNEVYAIMKKNRAIYMEISGHTDSIGGMEYNQMLSQQRAQNVIDYLSRKGIPAERFYEVALGSSQPIADNETERGRAVNRRVEFKIRQRKFELVQ